MLVPMSSSRFSSGGLPRLESRDLDRSTLSPWASWLRRVEDRSLPEYPASSLVDMWLVGGGAAGGGGAARTTREGATEVDVLLWIPTASSDIICVLARSEAKMGRIDSCCTGGSTVMGLHKTPTSIASKQAAFPLCAL